MIVCHIVLRLTIHWKSREKYSIQAAVKNCGKKDRRETIDVLIGHGDGAKNSFNLDMIMDLLL